MANESLWIIGASVFTILIVVVVIVATSSNSSTTSVARIPASPIVRPDVYLNPEPSVQYVLRSPSISRDIEGILTYLLERGVYIDTDEPFSDDVVSALKNVERWNLSSASPPTWYYRSYDNLHNYQIIWSFEYNSWLIKPAL